MSAADNEQYARYLEPDADPVVPAVSTAAERAAVLGHAGPYSDAIRRLCDEVDRLRADLADAQGTATEPGTWICGGTERLGLHPVHRVSAGLPCGRCWLRMNAEGEPMMSDPVVPEPIAPSYQDRLNRCNPGSAAHTKIICEMLDGLALLDAEARRARGLEAQVRQMGLHSLGCSGKVGTDGVECEWPDEGPCLVADLRLEIARLRAMEAVRLAGEAALARYPEES